MAEEPKTSWPELVKKPYAEAEERIKAENPNVSKVTPGQPMSRDYRIDRVRIMVDGCDVVIETPSVG